MPKRLIRENQPKSNEARRRHAAIRESAYRDFPPKAKGKKPSPPGIPSQIRRARESQGLTWYALAKRAAIPNQGAIRDIELGKDTKLSNLLAVAAALGLRLELVEQVA